MNGELSTTRQEYWRKLIGEQGRSGQSVSAFCRGRGVSEPSFYRWRRRLSEETAVKFALVETGTTENAACGLELAVASGERLRIAPGADASTLRMVLSVLRERR